MLRLNRIERSVMVKLKKETPAENPILLVCDTPDMEVDFVELPIKDRRELNKKLFKDTRGRYRVDMETEPLLSNTEGPAIIYPDGEEDYFINGFQASILQMPSDNDTVIEHAIEGVDWEKVCGYDLKLKPEFSATLLQCEEGEFHGWCATIFFADSDLELEVGIGFEDIDEMSGIFHNHLDLGPEEFFHTMEFGKRLLAVLEQPPEKGSYEFMYDDMEDELLGWIEHQVDEYVKKTNAKPEAVEKSSSSLGEMAMAGLAAVATAGVVGLISNGKAKAAKQLMANTVATQMVAATVGAQV